MSILDQVIVGFDRALRTLDTAVVPARGYPGLAQSEALASSDREVSIGLMRVNHSGEVCAQALYQGQALLARSQDTKNLLEAAADEERDHLAWCQQRLNELGGGASRLNPVWYAGSFGLGLASGLLGDKWSMAFLVETERQVEAHLSVHEERLPAADASSRKVLAAMREDEIRHRESGLAHGAAALPQPIRVAMGLASKVMTKTAYWV